MVVADAAYEGKAKFRLVGRRGMVLLTGHNRRRGRPKGEGRVANPRQRGRVRGLKGVVGQVEAAWVMAWSVMAQLLGEAGLPIIWVWRAVA